MKSPVNNSWKIFPCGADKRPLTPHGYKDASADPRQIKQWQQQYPGCLWGIPAQDNGFFAIDVDPDGIDHWKQLTSSNHFQYGPAQQTPRGGWHILFTLPDFPVPNNAGKFAPGIDLRSAGYICTGSGYRWADGHGPDQPILPAPDWLLETIRKMTKPKPEMNMRIAIYPEADKAGSYWLKWALDQARPGNRNETGFNLALQLRDSGLTKSQAEAIMYQYAAGVPGTDYTEEEALTSLREAYSAPARTPAAIPGTGREAIMPDQETINPITVLTTGEPKQQGSTTANKKPTDDELADAWLKTHRHNTAYGLGEWRRYADGVWQSVPEDLIKQEIGDILINAKIYGIRPTKYNTASVMEFARLAVCVRDDLWDAEIDLLPCKNGTLHIPTMTLREHRPEDYITFALPFDYDPAADAPTWQYALNSTIPEAAPFLQEFAGYALTTETKYEIAMWLYGPSGSGKSTILEGLQTMLGNRATLLGLADIERSRFALGDLKGKTLAIAAEQPAIYMQAAHILNSIISGERITTEQKFRNPITFYPKVKIAWAMNELPRLSESGSGLFRRVKVIKFPPLAEKDRDERIKEDIKDEGSGILNWALEGLRRLRKRSKFDIPECVMLATEDFKKNNDIPAVFVEECCIVGPDFKTQSQLLYDAYCEWCLKTKHQPRSSTSIASEWERLGFEKYKAAGKAFYRNIKLKDVYE